MKKLLSLLLAIAIVISCVSMVTFNAAAEGEAATPDSLMITINGTGDNYASHNKNYLFEADADFTGYKEIHLAVKNIGTKAGVLKPYLQATFPHSAEDSSKPSGAKEGWHEPAGLINVNNGAEIAPGETELMSFYIPVVDGKIKRKCLCHTPCNDGYDYLGVEKLWFRFSNQVASTFVVTCINPEETLADEALLKIGALNDTTMVTWDTTVASAHFSAAKLTKNGVELSLINAATTSHYAVADANLTKDMVKDGVISKSYEVYNTSNHTVSFSMAYRAQQNSDWKSIGVGKVYEIPAQTKLIYNLDIPVTVKEDGNAVVIYKGTEYDLSSLVLRCQFENTSYYNKKGATVIIKSNGEDDPLLDVVTNVQSNITQRHVNTLPEFSVGTPDYSSFKIVNTIGSTTSKQSITLNAGYNAFDQSFNDRLYATYTVHNNSTTKNAKVNMYFTCIYDGKVITPDSTYNWEKTVKAGTKMDFKISTLLKNGAITYTYTDKTDPANPVSVTVPLSVEDLILNVDVTVTAGTVKDEGIVIQSTGDTPNVNSFGKTNTSNCYVETPVYVMPELEYTPAPTNAPLKTPSTNGNVDAGIDNWNFWNAGTATVTTDPGDDDQEADETNNVIHFLPEVKNGTVSQYGSVFFDFGPYIIQDEFYGYNGHGEGTYRVKFRVRADESFANYKETENIKKFDVFFNSQGHKSKGDIVNIDGVIHKLPTHTYNSGEGKTVIMTDQWQWITFDIPVSQSLLDSLKLLRYSTDSRKAYAYQFGLRFDGSGSSRPYGKNQNFGYYIDDLSIQYLEQTGLSITATEDISSQHYARGNAGLTADMADKDGYITRSYTVYNNSKNAIKFMMQFQGGSGVTVNNNVYTGYSNLIDEDNTLLQENYVIPAYSKQVITVKAYLENGLVKYRPQDVEKEALGIEDDYAFCDPSTVYFRYEICSGYTLENGGNIMIQGHNGQSDALFNTKFNKKATTTIVYNYGDYPDYSVANKIEGANLEIGSSLTINYVVSFREGFEDSYLRITRNNDVRNVYGQLIAEGVYAGKYIFSYTGVNAQCMADIITAELVCGDAVIALNDYSVKEYAKNMYGTDAKLNQLLKDMLIYGAAVQEYLDYKTDELATKGVDWAQEATQFTSPNYVREVMQPDKSHKVESVGLHISYINKIYFRLGFTDYENVTITLTKGGENVEFLQEGNLIYTDAIMATGYADVYTLTITNNLTGISNVVSYNVNAYISQKNTSASVGGIVTAMSNYGNAALAYRS